MADNFINYAGNATIPREIITERLNETIKKLPEESIDVVDFVMMIDSSYSQWLVLSIQSIQSLRRV